MPFFLPLTAVSYLFPGPHAVYFSVIISAMYAAIPCAFFVCLYHAVRPTKLILYAFVFSLSLLFGLNGLVMSSLWLAHVEFFIPIFILLFLSCLLRRRYKAALIFMVLALLIREDSGFHIVSVVGLIWLYEVIKQRSAMVSHDMLMFWLGALFVSVIMCLLTVFNIDGGTSPFWFMYASGSEGGFLGRWDGINTHGVLGLLGDRIGEIIQTRSYIWAPWVILFLTALITLDGFLVLGAVCVVPWALMSLLGQGSLVHSLSGYYAFPFLFTLAWPTVSVLYIRFREHIDEQTHRVRSLLILQTVMIVVSLFQFVGSNRVLFLPLSPSFMPGYHDIRFHLSAVPPVESYIKYLARHNDHLGDLILGDGIASFNGDFWRNRDAPTKIVYDLFDSKEAIHPADTFIFFLQGHTDEAVRSLFEKRLPGHYYAVQPVEGTQIRIAIKRPLNEKPAAPKRVCEPYGNGTRCRLVKE